MFIISEIFPQHGGSLRVAEQMILQSKLGGADAVKVQLYPASMFPGADGASRDYLELDFDGLKRLKTYADQVDIALFGTPFDFERLDWCLKLDLPYLKTAARTNRENPELVQAMLDTGKPVVLSVPSDMDFDEVPHAEQAIYLYCVMKYPAFLEDMKMPDFKNSPYHGLSDHSIGIAASLWAFAHGAEYLEKHFTLSHGDQCGTEQAHVGSMTYEDLVQIHRIGRHMERLCK